MKNITKYIISLVAFGCVSSAYAGFVVEPFLGYSMGDWKTTTSKEDISGTELGIRIGGTFTLFSAGLEYSMANLEIDTKPSQDFDTTDLGLFFGVDFPVLIRAYATFFVSSKGESSNNDYEGSGGYRLGVGYTGLPFVSINFEHIQRKYDELNGSTIADRTATVNQLSISLPLP